MLPIPDHIQPFSRHLLEQFREQGIADMVIETWHRNVRLDRLPTPNTVLTTYIDSAIHYATWADGGHVPEASTDEDVIETIDIMVANVALLTSGEMPVLFLSPGQQDALEHSDPPDRETALAQPPVFGDAPILVIPARPISIVGGVEIVMIEFPHDCVGAGVHCAVHYTQSPGEVGRLVAYLGLDESADAFIDDDELWNDGTHRQFTQASAGDFVRMCRSIGFAARMFGLTPEPPRMTRAQQRQAQRDLERRPAPSKRLAVRYLHDPHATIKPTLARDTGRHVRPHWRRGHFRRIWSGPLDSPDRKATPHFIPPVLVNSHLGAPAPSMYRWTKGT